MDGLTLESELVPIRRKNGEVICKIDLAEAAEKVRDCYRKAKDSQDDDEPLLPERLFRDWLTAKYGGELELMQALELMGQVQRVYNREGARFFDWPDSPNSTDPASSS